jgi:hypothetical protein
MSVENKCKAFNVRLQCGTAHTQIGVKHWRAPREGIACEPVVARSCRALRQSPGHVCERGVAEVEHEPAYHDRRDASRMNKAWVTVTEQDNVRTCS